MFDSISSYYKLRFQVWLVVMCAVVLIFSAYTTYVETRYLVFAKTVSATLVGVEEVRSTSRRSNEVTLRVKYTFSEPDGTKRNEADRMSSDWTAPSAGVVDVQYIPGKKEWSRIAGNDRLWLTLPFIICSTIVIVFLVRFYREFQEHERRKATR